MPREERHTQREDKAQRHTRGSRQPARREAWHTLPIRALGGGLDVLHTPATERPGSTMWSPSGNDKEAFRAKVKPCPGQGLARSRHARPRSLTLKPARSYVKDPPTPWVNTATSCSRAWQSHCPSESQMRPLHLMTPTS